MLPPMRITDEELCQYAAVQDDVYIQEMAYRLVELREWMTSTLGAGQPRFNTQTRVYERVVRK